MIFPAATTVLTQSIPVNVFGDFDVENDESFSVVLSNPSSNAQIVTGTATGTIQNDDLVSVSVGDVSALEGNSGTTAFSFSVMIDQSHPSEAVVVDLETLDDGALAGQDYNATTPQLIFAAATTSLAQDVVVDVIGDEEVEPDEGFTLNINSVSANTAILDGVGSGTILNDDSPPVLNTAPVADAGPDQTVFVGNTVILDGSVSSDADGDPLTFSWTLISAPPGSTAVLTDPTAVIPSIDGDLSGTYVIQLIVNDGTVDSAPDTMTILAEFRTVFLLIDEDSIGKDKPPNSFTEYRWPA